VGGDCIPEERRQDVAGLAHGAPNAAHHGCVLFLSQPPIRFFIPAHPPHNRHAIHPLGRVLRLSEGPRAGNGEGMFDAWQCACGKLFASEEARRN
jgi:hypothetical protein